MPGASITVDPAPPAARPWLGATVLGVAVVATCWAAAMVYWRAAGSAPSAMATGLLLVALPAAILAALWIGKIALPARSGAAAALPAADTVAAEPARMLPAIAAAAVRLRGGESVEELAETLRANASPCALDGELTDDAGYPVLSGRAGCADPDAAREAMAPWLAQRGMAEPGFSDEQWRALAMAAAVAGELAQHALVHPLLPDYLAAAPADRAAVALPMLQLLPVLPASWQAGQRQAAADWLRHLVEQQGWPAERLLLSPAPSHEAGFALLDTLSHACGLTLLLACESTIGDDSVRDLIDHGLLFSGKTGRGQVPGEGAAGLLLADGEQAALLDAPALAALHGGCGGQRPAPADAGGKFDGALLASLGSQALADSKTEAAAVAAICADADFRPNRMAELMSVAGTVLPELDLTIAMLGVGACCGTTGAAGTLAALALAAHEALANGAPVLCMSNSDSHYRCALVVRPA
jgi:hypothetical protein